MLYAFPLKIFASNRLSNVEQVRWLRLYIHFVLLLLQMIVLSGLMQNKVNGLKPSNLILPSNEMLWLICAYQSWQAREFTRFLFALQKMLGFENSDQIFLWKWKPSEEMKLATNGFYWNGYETLSSFFSVVGYLTTFTESDTVPQAYLTLSFTLHCKSVN